MDAIDVTDAARLVRELRAAGLSEWTIAASCRSPNRVFKFARRHCRWRGENPIELLEGGERPKPSATPERRIYAGDELAQTLAASTEPWTTLFRLAECRRRARERAARALVGGRRPARPGRGDDPLHASRSTATGRARRAQDRGEQGDAAAAALDGADAARAQGAHAGADGSALVRVRHADGPAARAAQRPARAIPRAGARPRRGRAADVPGAVRARRARAPGRRRRWRLRPARRPRSELPRCRTSTRLRHAAAMDCDDAEEARDLLRHKNSNVTRAIYRAHFDDRRRANLRARMEARMEATDGAKSAGSPASAEGEVTDLQRFRAAEGVDESRCVL